MRLIDADSLREKAKHHFVSPDCALMLIDSQPTVYDMNKVIEQLENCEDYTTFRYSKEEGILYEVEADVWAIIKDGTETEIKIKTSR